MKRLLPILFLLLPSAAWAACGSTVTVKDGNGSSQTFCVGVVGGNLITNSNIVDSSGANIASVSAGGALKVDGSAVTQPVSGTVTSNQGGAPWSENVTQIGGASLSFGQAAMASSIPVAIANNQSAVPVSGTVTANQGGAPWSVTGSGTAGTAASGVVTVQGISSMTAVKVDGSGVTQPVSGTVTANQGGAPWADNISQWNGATSLAGNGVTGTGSPRVTLSSDNSVVPLWGQGATAAAVPANAVQMAGNGSGNLTAPTVCDSYTPFSFASTSAQKIIAKASAKKIYICSINLVVGAANNVALIEGTKVTNECDTSTAGMAGGTTAATGWNLAANGGLTLGSGIGVVIKTANANFDVCLLASGSAQTSGGISWTQF